MRKFFGKYFVLPLMVALWVLILALSLLFYHPFLTNGELGLVELLTNVMYIVLIYFTIKCGRECDTSRHLVYALVLLSIVLLDRELNIQRRVSTLFVDVSYYRSHIQLWTHIALYLPFLYFSAMALKKYRSLIKPLFLECLPTAVFLVIATIVSQIADKTGDSGVWLALEETLEFIIPCLLIYIVHLIFKVIVQRQSLGKVF